MGLIEPVCGPTSARPASSATRVLAFARSRLSHDRTAPALQATGCVPSAWCGGAPIPPIHVHGLPGLQSIRFSIPLQRIPRLPLVLAIRLLENHLAGERRRSSDEPALLAARRATSRAMTRLTASHRLFLCVFARPPTCPPFPDCSHSFPGCKQFSP
jgi:hypothetical protein